MPSDSPNPSDPHRLAPGEELQFILAGNATFTVRSRATGQYFTFRVRKHKTVEHLWWLARTSASGQNYAPLGTIRDDQSNPPVQAFPQFGYEEDEHFRAAAWALHNLQKRPDRFAEQAEVWHEGVCGRCGRALTVPESIERGIGPECWLAIQAEEMLDKFL